MKLKDIRSLNLNDLTERLEEAHQELFDLQFRLAVKKLVNHREIPRIKREIARLKTIIQEIELGINRNAMISKDTS